ncbi:MAG: hypothetical protein V1898_04695 [Patescibacteria group bacterium]
MSKKPIIILVAIVVAVIIILSVWFVIKNNSDTNTNTVDVSMYDGLVEYKDSYGSICPLDVNFIGSRTSPTIECVCPEGYIMESYIVGSTAGDECYGPGTDCPIISSTCVIE